MSDSTAQPGSTIFIGIDDTDIVGSPGTNQLARAIVADLAHLVDLQRITRHQLLDDPRVPYTSQNGSASILLTPREPIPADEIFEICRSRMLKWFVEGSDPGLCVSLSVPDAIVEWGQRCKRELVTKLEALELAIELGIRLEGLGGTRGGVIGALAAIGLSRDGNDGRVVMWKLWPDDLSGVVPMETIRQRDITVVDRESFAVCDSGLVDVGKHLRPNIVAGRATLWVTKNSPHEWTALKLK